LGCDDSDASRQVCNQALEQTVAMTSSLARLDRKLSEFTIQPECAACPPSRTCPDDSAALTKGDAAIREMEQVKELVKRYRDDGSFGTTDLIAQLNDLAAE
jgi:hypothetical protein